MTQKQNILAVTVIVILYSLICVYAFPQEYTDTQAVRAIIGEAEGESLMGQIALGVGILNRGTLSGVYGVNANKRIDAAPEWVWEKARKAWQLSKTDYRHLHDGAFWGSKIVDKDWIAEMERKGFIKVYEVGGHVFYKRGAK